MKKSHIKKLLAMGAIVLSIGLMSGCDSMHRGDVGLLAGGVAGGAAGHALTGGSALGTVGGAVGGAYLGRQLAK